MTTKTAATVSHSPTLRNAGYSLSESVSDYREGEPVFRLGELFCGAGGVGLGAKMADVGNFQHVWATDIDKNSCHTYSRNLPEAEVVCKDIRKLKFQELSKKGEIDALCFGFPCNDFSSIGKKAGISGVYGELYKYCVKAVKYFSPRWFLAEKVGGIRNADDGTALASILREFKNAGYKIYPHFYSFDEYGIPQRQQRIIIVGIHSDEDVDFRVPSPERYKQIDISVESALAGIKANAPNNELTNQSKMVIERLKHIKPGENAFTATLPSHLQLNINGATLSQAYRRLDKKFPAYTITGIGGGGMHVYHWSENRALTNRERARLQSFPDNFIFEGNKESVRKQIGIAVPPYAAKIIFEALAKSFMGIEYPFIHSNLTKLKC